MKCDESKLPKWAQKRLNAARAAAANPMRFIATKTCDIPSGAKEIVLPIGEHYGLRLTYGDTLDLDQAVTAVQKLFGDGLRLMTPEDYEGRGASQSMDVGKPKKEFTHGDN